MGVASKLEGILSKQIKCHVAWLPLANTFALGDYGVISGGVFVKMGNVAEFGGSFQTARSPDVELDFVSASTTVEQLVGEAKVNVLPEGALDAKIRYRFNEAESFLIKAKTVTVEAIQDLHALMRSMKTVDAWEKRFSVVRQIWVAESAAVLCALKAGTELTFAGDVPALNQLQLGSASSSLSVATNEELGLRLVGKSGVIGLGFAKFGLFGGVQVLGGAAAPSVRELITVPDDAPLADDL